MKRSILLFALAGASIFLSSPSSAQSIYTFAGIAGTNGYTGDDSLATIAQLSGPSGIACSASGNVYFADSRNNVVRMVNTSGIITTIAGNGTAGYTGDGGAATAATLRGPNGIAIDATGNIFITDTRNNVVRKVDVSGNISTVAGSGAAGYSGDTGPATDAQLRGPVGIAVDGVGNIFIADSRNHVIREVGAATTTINTIAGNNIPGYTGDGTAATAAQLNNPSGIALTSSGKLYIADSRNNVIRMINTSGIISTFAGTGVSGHSGDGGPATTALLHFPYDVKLDATGNVFVGDSSNTVRMVNTGGTINDYAGTGVAGYNGDGGLATAALLNGPVGLAIDASHNVYISTQGSNVIRRVGAPVAGIHITSNAGDTLCIGHFTNFTATPIADATPHYQWQQNGVNVGTDNVLYTPTSIAKGDIIDCILMTSIGGAKLAISNNLRVDSMPVTGTITGPSAMCIGGTINLRNLTGGGIWTSGNTAIATVAPPSRVTGLSLGSTFIYDIFTNGCGTDSAKLSMTVNANTVSPISGPPDVCVGSSATFSDATVAGRWRTRPGPFGTIDSVSGVFTAGFIPGPTIVTYTTSPGCSRTDTIMIDSLPVNAAISGLSIIDSGAVITLTNPNAGGVWSSGNTTIAIVDGTGNVTGMSSGTTDITYTITTPAGCSADTTFSVTVINTTFVHKVLNATSFNIYPNPSSGTLNVSGAGKNGTSTVTIADVSGRTIYSSVFTSNNAMLDISVLKSGIYMITVKSDQGFYTGKLEIVK